MKVKVITEYSDKIGEIVKGVKFECSPAESLVVSSALLRMAGDPEAGERNRKDASRLYRTFVDEYRKAANGGDEE